MKIEVDSLCFSYGERQILDHIGFEAGRGELIALLGPNGAGKSTLMRCILGFMHEYSGSVKLGGKDVRELKRAALSRLVAYIPQRAPLVYDYSVVDTVLMGVTGSLGVFRQPDASNEARALELLGSLGIGRLADRGCEELSGGERQLVLLARALIQDAPILIMDEPTANLDYGNQNRVMERVSELAGRGYIILFSTHDPNQALLYATRALTLCGGRILTDGPPDAALTEDTLEKLYGIGVRRVPVPEGGSVCIPRKNA